ncbi:MAG: thiamine pyrophosphate-binding protein [Candidatus Schekmanbacteria bacterium]|nr:thiamine pyrophosphate-binding protein [Candidatus Schekmanbacteria bacterium]
MKIKVSDFIVQYLSKIGVKYIFCLPGAPLLPFFDALYRNKSIETILVKHEEAAAAMADGYARVSGKMGVCCATTGPGTTNLITGIAEAYMDGIPMLVITAQVPLYCYGKGTFQDSSMEGLNTAYLLKQITKLSTTVLSKHRVVDTLNKAYICAHSGKKGPVHLSFPTEIFSEVIDFDWSDGQLEQCLAAYTSLNQYYNRKLVHDAANQILNAKKPLLLAGFGAVSSRASGEIMELAEQLNIPVVTSYRAKGVIADDHPLYLGSVGLGGAPSAEDYIHTQEIDVLLAVGTDLDEFTTNSWDPKFRPLKSLIHIDVQPETIGKNYPTNICLVGDAKTILTEINLRIFKAIHGGKYKIKTSKEEIAEWKSKTTKIIDAHKMESLSVPLLPQRLTHEIRQALPRDAIVFCDGANNLIFTVHYMPFYQPGTFIIGGYGNMSYGTMAVIGGKIAAPDRVVVAISGDGGFLMNGMEVSTAVNHNIPVIWIIHNNGVLGAVHDLQKLLYGERYIATSFKRTDFKTVAEGLGAAAYRIACPNELLQIMPEIIAAKRPTVIDAIIDDQEIPPIRNRIEGKKRLMESLLKE